MNPRTNFLAFFLALAGSTLSLNAQLLVTEIQSDGLSDFWELTNVGATAVDLSNYKWIDSARSTTGAVAIPAGASIAAGESVIFTGQAAATFRSNWGIANTVQVFTGTSVPGLGSGDAVTLYDAANTEVLYLSYAASGFTRSDGSASAGGHAGISAGGATAQALIWDPGFGAATPRYTFADGTVLGTFAATANSTNKGSPGTTVGIPAVSIASASIAEGNSGTSTLALNVTRTETSSAFSVDYAVTGGSANASDYTLASGTLNFTVSGAATLPIHITVNGDTDTEPDDTVIVTLTNLVNVTGTTVLGTAVGTGTITNDDTVPASITTQPAGTTITSGGTTTLTLVATGSPAPTIQWYQGTSGNTSTPVGTNSSNFITPALTATTSYWARVSNVGATVDSDTATVTIAPGATAVDLSSYVRIGRYSLPEPTRTALPPGTPVSNLLCQEASGVAYNWDTDTLFIIGDGGRSVTQVSKTGQLIDTMTLDLLEGAPQGTAFYDPEGITYVGGGQFVFTEERDRKVVKFTYAAGTTLTRAAAQTVALGTPIGNEGLEGISYDPQTSGFILMKEISPQGIFQTNIDFVAGTATNGSATTVNSVDLFNPGLAGMADFADVFALSNLPTMTGQPQQGNLLVLSQASNNIVNISRSGVIASSLTIVSDPGNPLSAADQQHEGLTMDRNGILYVVNENGGGSIDYPQLWVYAPSTVTNLAPTAVALNNQVTSLAENVNTTNPVKVADIVVTDDGLGTNTLSVSGTDASAFEITNAALYIKAGTVLDFETKTSYSVTVNVDDTTVGNTPDATAAYALSITDVVNEGALSTLIVSEVAPWSSGNGLGVSADWFEVTNTGASAVDITGWKVDDSSAAFSSAIALSGITSIAAGESVIFLESSVANPAATVVANFKNLWFGSNVPVGLQVGTYQGSGIGLSTGGDAVNLYNAAGVLQANVVFGVAPAGPAFATFNNAIGLNNATISLLSVIGVTGAFVATNDVNEAGSPGTIKGGLFVSEVAPWSSGNSTVAADWFEVTNTTATAVDITGWKVDDSSNTFASAATLNGITSIAPGESVIFIETADLPAATTAFRNVWFGATLPAGLQIGSYSGAGLGLGTGGDGVNLFNSGGTRITGVSFGTSTALFTFDNKTDLATLATLSAVGTNGAFLSANGLETGSPGTTVNALPIVTITATDANAAESANDPGTFRIFRSGSTSAALTVNYMIASGAGQAAITDYTPALPITAVIGIGESFVDVTVTPVEDTIIESNETVSLTLVDGFVYDLGASAGAAVTIADNDAALSSFTVASGDVNTNSAILLAKVGVLGAVNVSLFSDEGLTNLVSTASGTVTDVGIPLKWSFTGLAANTRYFYQVTDSASTAKTGKFKTAPAATATAAVHFGISGDQRGELAPYASVKNVASRNLDFFLQFGDNIYADVSSVNVPIPQCRSLAEYRAKNNEVYAVRYGLNTLADLRASTAVFAVIDDHEVTNDFSGGALRTSDARFAADTGAYINETQTFLNGTQAFREYHPIANLTYGATGDPITANKSKLYRYSVQGKTTATFVLDTRSFRSDALPPVTDITNPAQVGAFLAASFTPGRTLLGEAQKAEFKADLLAAQAAGVKWKFVCFPEPIQNFGPLGAQDRYEGYAAERTELLKFIDDNHLTDVVFVTADFHGTVVNRLSYQLAAFGPQIQTDSIEIVTGAIAYDKPFGPTIVDLAIAAGLAAPGTDAIYQSLDAVSKEGLVFNNIINPNLAALGYNQVSLTTNPLPNVTLLSGLFTATNSYGWTEFTIDPVTLELNVRTWGIAPYSRTQLDADPSGVSGRTPAVVSEFVMTPTYNTFGTWLTRNGYTSGGLGTDSDNDGLTDGLEYFFNQNPNHGGDVVNMPRLFPNGGALELDFTRLTDIGDATAAFEISSDLSTWTDAILGLDFTVVSATVNGEETSFTYALPGTGPSAPGASATYLTTNTSIPLGASLGGVRVINEGMVGAGRLSGENLDIFGETQGAASGLAITDWAWDGNQFSGKFQVLPDRGYNSGAIFSNYAARLHRVDFTFSPYYGAGPVAQTQILPTYVGTTKFTYLDGATTKFTTGLNAAGTGSLFGQTVGVASAANGLGGSPEALLSFDAEAVHLFADGSGYVSDEYGAYIARFNSSKQITGLTQLPEAARPHKPLGTLNFDAVAAPTNGRRNNQGLEGLSVTPDGTRLFALLQSATVQDTNGSQQQTRTNARLFVYDIVGAHREAPVLIGEYIVKVPQIDLNGNGSGLDGTAAQSEIVAIGDKSFLMLPRDGNGMGKGTTDPIVFKSVQLVDFASATNILGTYDAEGAQVSPAGVLAAGVHAAATQEIINILNPADLAKFGFNTNTAAPNSNTLNEKLEGMALVPDLSTPQGNDFFLFIANDNDFQSSNVKMLNAAGTIVSYGDGRLNAGITNDAIFYAFRITIDAGGKRFYRFALEEQ